MEDLRDTQLDRLASGVADERHAQAESRDTETGLLQAVLKRMRALKITTFKAHGVQFTRVPGDEKLQVRLTKDGGDDEVPQDDTDIEAQEEAEGDDAAAEDDQVDEDADDGEGDESEQQGA